MIQAVYADILVLINTYVNFALLRLAGVISRRRAGRLRVFLSALFGGFYSLVILIDKLPNSVLFLSRAAALVLMLLVAFGYETRRAFLKSLGAFFLVNFIFAGLMFALWLLFAPQKMLFSNGIVYFDIDVLTLAVLTVLCYAAVSLMHRLTEFKAPKNTVYELEAECFGESFRFRAFLDTGNSLKEPFSGFPVIIADSSVRSFGGKTLADSSQSAEEPLRPIVCSTVSGDGVLSAFRPKKVHIKGLSVDFDTDRVFLALTNEKIKNGEYTALLNCAVFENKTEETETDYV